MKIYFLTYGDNNFYLSKKNLCYLAEESGLFNQVISLGPKDLGKEFKKEFKNVLNKPIGGGYWIWKYKIISELLNQINKNDIVIYCDAGASLNTSPKAIVRFKEYINIISSKDVSQLRMKCEDHFIEKYYTNKKLFDYFKVTTDSKIGTSTQLQAGHQFYKKNDETMSYFDDYSKVVSSDYNLITDFYSSEKQINGFIEHRHDQSIFSILSKMYKAYIIENETEFRTKPSMQYDYPFLSVRSYGHGKRDYFRYFFNRNKFLSKTIYFKD